MDTSHWSILMRGQYSASHILELGRHISQLQEISRPLQLETNVTSRRIQTTPTSLNQYGPHHGRVTGRHDNQLCRPRVKGLFKGRRNTAIYGWLQFRQQHCTADRSRHSEVHGIYQDLSALSCSTRLRRLS